MYSIYTIAFVRLPRLDVVVTHRYEMLMLHDEFEAAVWACGRAFVERLVQLDENARVPERTATSFAVCDRTIHLDHVCLVNQVFCIATVPVFVIETLRVCESPYTAKRKYRVHRQAYPHHAETPHRRPRKYTSGHSNAVVAT